MAALNDLSIRFGSLQVPAQDHPLGLPPSYSMQSVMDQVPGATLTPDGYRDLWYPKGTFRSPTGSLHEALSYFLMLVPSTSRLALDALYKDLEDKAWENWSQIIGVSSKRPNAPAHMFSVPETA